MTLHDVLVESRVPREGFLAMFARVSLSGRDGRLALSRSLLDLGGSYRRLVSDAIHVLLRLLHYPIRSDLRMIR